MSDYKLGPKVIPKPAPAQPEKLEPANKAGTIFRDSTGKMQTKIYVPGPRTAPVIQPETD